MTGKVGSVRMREILVSVRSCGIQTCIGYMWVRYRLAESVGVEPGVLSRWRRQRLALGPLGLSFLGGGVREGALIVGSDKDR